MADRPVTISGLQSAMGFRFQRRFKILPGITLNVNKSGVSTSIGTRGAHVTLGHGNVRNTVGIPGTGLSYTTTYKTHQDVQGGEPPATVSEPAPDSGAGRVLLYIALLLVFALALAWTLRR
jgi:hypothetical protein